MPGDVRPVFEHGNQARQILNDAEDDLREWQPELEEVGSSAQGLGSNLMPESTANGLEEDIASGRELGGTVADGSRVAGHNDTSTRVTSDGSVATGPTYAESETV